MNEISKLRKLKECPTLLIGVSDSLRNVFKTEVIGESYDLCHTNMFYPVDTEYMGLCERNPSGGLRYPISPSKGKNIIASIQKIFIMLLMQAYEMKKLIGFGIT